MYNPREAEPDTDNRTLRTSEPNRRTRPNIALCFGTVYHNRCLIENCKCAAKQATLIGKLLNTNYYDPPNKNTKRREEESDTCGLSPSNGVSTARSTTSKSGRMENSPRKPDTQSDQYRELLVRKEWPTHHEAYTWTNHENMASKWNMDNSNLQKLRKTKGKQYIKGVREFHTVSNMREEKGEIEKRQISNRNTNGLQISCLSFNFVYGGHKI